MRHLRQQKRYKVFDANNSAEINGPSGNVVLSVPLVPFAAMWHSLGHWGFGGNGYLRFPCICIIALCMFCYLSIVVVGIRISPLWTSPRHAAPFSGGTTFGFGANA